jgi:hypothetical protein
MNQENSENQTKGDKRFDLPLFNPQDNLINRTVDQAR